MASFLSALTSLAHTQAGPVPVVQTPPPPPATILVVDPTGTITGSFMTIKDAVVAAQVAQTSAWIQVKAGTYHENNIDFGYQELVLESIDGIGMAVIDGQTTPPTSNSIFVLQHAQTAASVINGFVLTNGRATAPSMGGAIHCTQFASPTIINNTFISNSAAAGGAIYAEFACTPLIAGNDFQKNGRGAASGSFGPDCAVGGAIDLNGCTAIVRDNRFVGNRAQPNGGAMYVHNSASVTIENNLFDANVSDIEIGIAPVNGGALAVMSATVIASYNTFSDNIAQSLGGAVWISGQSSFPSQFNNNLYVQNGGICLKGGAVYCDASSPIFRGDTFVENLCELLGGAICCEGAGSAQIASSSISRNFAYSHGGGIACVSDADATIVGCDITKNDVGTGGTGAGVYVGSSGVTIQLNRITGNGMGTTPYSSALCLRGGGIDYDAGALAHTAIIEGNVILQNGIASSSLALAGGGGIAMRNMNPATRFVSNVVARNIADFGGSRCAGVLVQEDGQSAYAGRFAFLNNTIVYNLNGLPPAQGTGGGLMFDGVTSQPPFLVENCIILGNQALSDLTHDPDIHNAGSVVPTLSFCDVSAGPTFPTAWISGARMMFGIAPRFVDAVHDDYHLLAVSPLIDTGNFQVVVPIDIDFDGQPRINGASVDRGADEF